MTARVPLLAAIGVLGLAAAASADNQKTEVYYYARVEQVNPDTRELTLSGWETPGMEVRRDIYTNTGGGQVFEREVVEKRHHTKFPFFGRHREKVTIKFKEKEKVAPVAYEYPRLENGVVRWVDRPADFGSLRPGQTVAVRVERDPGAPEVREVKSIVIMGDQDRP